MTDSNHNTPLSPSSPEEGLVIHPDAEPMNLDMLQGIINRSSALLDFLTGYFSTPADERSFVVKDRTLANVIWQLSGNLDLIKLLMEHASEQPRKLE